MTEHLTDVDQLQSKELAKQLRDNATVLLIPGTAIPTGAIAGALQMAAAEIERLQLENDACGLQCSATMKSLVAEIEQLKQDLARTESAHVVVMAENTHYKQRVLAAQARIDALMLEYCPNEMTPEQLSNWGAHQRPSEMTMSELNARHAGRERRDDWGELTPKLSETTGEAPK